MKKIIFTIFILAASSNLLLAQVHLSFLEKDAEKPVEGIVVSIRSLKNGQAEQLITNAKGTVRVLVALPFIYETRHIGYHSKRDTISENADQVIFLNSNTQSLEEIVITGQYEPQSAKNSVYRVVTLTNQRIQDQGAVSLQDALSNSLNISFSQDNATGVAGISLQGISGQNVKVLMDGVPIIGRSGVQNEVDLNQINVNDVEKVEIVEGPMAVNYGSDALAGVINIITKKDSEGKLNLNVGLHEETVGNEYNFFSDGIHAPSLRIGYKPSKNWYTQLSTRVNRFGGWQGNSNGRNKEWHPKTQHFVDGLVRYEKNDFTIYYKLNFLDELLENMGQEVKPQLKDPFAVDEAYNAKRWVQQLHTDWRLGKIKSHTSLSYTHYERTSKQFSKNLVTGNEQNTADSEQDTIAYRSFFFRNTATDFLSSNHIKSQIGLEGTFESAAGTTLNDGDKHLTDIAIFVSTEFKVSSKLKIRPGIRATYNSIFITTPMPSLNVKYDITNNTQWRLGYGRGFRAPSVRELYHEFIDSNHNLIGNKNLEPEKSHNINGDISHTFSTVALKISMGGFYNYIDNRISTYTPDEQQITTYTNILKYKTTGLVLRINYSFNNLQLGAGMTQTGIYQRLNESFDVPQFVFSPEMNFNVKYNWPLLGLQCNLFYRYTGSRKGHGLYTDEETGEQAPVLTEIESYQLLDITVNKKLGQNLTLGIGARNIINETYLNSNQQGGTHGQVSNSVGYGRSYFIKMNFQLIK